MDMFFHDYNTLNIFATEVSEVLSIRHKVMLNIIQKYDLIPIVQKLAIKELRMNYKNKIATMLVLYLKRVRREHVIMDDLLKIKFEIFKDPYIEIDVLKIAKDN